LKENPDVFAQIERELEDEADQYAYFSEGTFQQDLEDLVNMARWAQSSGATRLRLVSS
jgi:hypothetical protein